MKAKLLILLPLLLAAGACDKKDEGVIHPLTALSPLSGETGLTYPQSLSKWNELKAQHGNSYVYHTVFTSFTGHGSTTELRVENGSVVSRIYHEYIIQEYDRHEITYSYSENASTLGTHEKGAPLMTIDELYQTCARDYLAVDSETNTIYFQTAEVGLMTVCGFVPNGCLDDCFTGVKISAFGWLE